MKWWFSSWNLFLFSLSKVCRISSADCFISGFTASQSPQLRLRSIVGYTLLNTLSFAPHLLPKFFSTIYIEKRSWKNIFNLCPTSFFCLLHFVLLSVFVLTSPRKTNYLSIIYGHSKPFCGGIFVKVFTPHYNWKVTSRLLGYFTKIFICFLYLYWKSYT